METIKTYENFIGDLARLDPKREENDERSKKVFLEILSDFEKYNFDLRKVNVIDDGGTTLNLDKLQIGKYYTIIYIFGKYHPVKNSNSSANSQNGNREIKIVNVPFSFSIRKNSLEKMFNTSRINLGQTRLTDTKIVHNYNYNPRVEGQWNKLESKVDEYKISPDNCIKLFKYFVDEYNKQYPDLKYSKYKSMRQIDNLERGIKPTIKYIHFKNKFGEEITFGIRKGDNESDIKKKFFNIKKEEIENYQRDRDIKDSEPYVNRQKEIKSNWESKINGYLINSGFDLKSNITNWEKYGFSFKFYGNYEMIIEFRLPAGSDRNQINEKIKKFLQNDFGEFELKNKRISESEFKFTKGDFFILLHFENEN